MNSYDPIRVNQEIPYVGNKIDYARLNDWFTPNTIVYEDDANRLRCFTEGRTGNPIIILPPQAGHTSQIADYDNKQSVVQSAIENTSLPVYCIEWRSCTKERKDESYEDLTEQVFNTLIHTSIHLKHSYLHSVHLVGLCQGGTLATIFTAIYPHYVASLTVAGAPIDVQKGGVLDQAINQPQIMFDMAVNMFGRGIMSGQAMLLCWMSANIHQHYYKRFQTPMDYRKARFESWYYEHVQDIAGGWYLWLVENLFKQNKLIKGEMELFGRKVDLSAITCKTNLVVGTGDDISPPNHTLSLGDHVSGEVESFVGEGGHIGVFMGRKMIANQWYKLFTKMDGRDPRIRHDLPQVKVENTSVVYLDGLVRGENVQIHKSSFIYQNVTLGDNVVVKNGCIIEEGAVVLSGTVIPSGTHIKAGETFGG